MTNRKIELWLHATVDSICSITGGNQRLTLQIHQAYSGNSRRPEVLQGQYAQFEARTFQCASQIVADTRNKLAYDIKLGPTQGHKLVADQPIGVKVSWDEEAIKAENLGLTILGWAVYSNFDAVRKQVKNHNEGVLNDRREKLRLAEAMRERNFKLYEKGAKVGVSKPITTQTLITLARFFQHRAWPPGIIWATVQGGALVEVPEPEMIPAPKHVGVVVDELFNARLDELRATILGKPVTLNPDEAVRPANRREAKASTDDTSEATTILEQAFVRAIEEGEPKTDSKTIPLPPQGKVAQAALKLKAFKEARKMKLMEQAKQEEKEKSSAA